MKINLNYRILVLNRLWQAVNIVGVERGFSLLLQDNAQVIYTGDQSYRLMNSDAWLKLSQEMQDLGESPDECIQTVRLKIIVPKVLLLRALRCSVQCRLCWLITVWAVVAEHLRIGPDSQCCPSSSGPMGGRAIIMVNIS